MIELRGLENIGLDITIYRSLIDKQLVISDTKYSVRYQSRDLTNTEDFKSFEERIKKVYYKKDQDIFDDSIITHTIDENMISFVINKTMSDRMNISDVVKNLLIDFTKKMKNKYGDKYLPPKINDMKIKVRLNTNEDSNTVMRVRNWLHIFEMDNEPANTVQSQLDEIVASLIMHPNSMYNF